MSAVLFFIVRMFILSKVSVSSHMWKMRKWMGDLQSVQPGKFWHAWLVQWLDPINSCEEVLLLPHATLLTKPGPSFLFFSCSVYLTAITFFCFMARLNGQWGMHSRVFAYVLCFVSSVCLFIPCFVGVGKNLLACVCLGDYWELNHYGQNQCCITGTASTPITNIWKQAAVQGREREVGSLCVREEGAWPSMFMCAAVQRGWFEVICVFDLTRHWSKVELGCCWLVPYIFAGMYLLV